jgi:hypothetical protein
MALSRLSSVGRPANPPAPLRKIAIEEHFIDPALANPNYGDSFSGEFRQQESSYADSNPHADAVSARLRDLCDGRIEENDAAGIDVAVLFHTIGGVEGTSNPAVAVSTARKISDFLAAKVVGAVPRRGPVRAALDGAGRAAGAALPAPSAARASRAGSDLPRAPGTGRRGVGFRARDGNPRARPGARRGVRPASRGEPDPGPSTSTTSTPPWSSWIPISLRPASGEAPADKSCRCSCVTGTTPFSLPRPHRLC